MRRSPMVAVCAVILQPGHSMPNTWCAPNKSDANNIHCPNNRSFRLNGNQSNYTNPLIFITKNELEVAQPNHAYCTAYKTNAMNTNVVNWKSLNSIKSTTQPFRCLFFYLKSIIVPLMNVRFRDMVEPWLTWTTTRLQIRY